MKDAKVFVVVVFCFICVGLLNYTALYADPQANGKPVEESFKKTHQYLFIRSTQKENVYGPYVAEILKAEGLNGFEIVDLDKAAMPQLGKKDIVILTRCFLRFAEMDKLINAVKLGTALVCIQPEPDFMARLGWVPDKTAVYPGWVQIRSGYPGAKSTIQTHVPITNALPRLFDIFPDVEIVADSVNADWKPKAYPAEAQPAAAKQKMGEGSIAFFLYDLPKAVARIRFGDPELASHTIAQSPWKHRCLFAGDLFAGYLDKRVMHLPQADFHCQLLAKLVTDIAPYPLARLWYYEKAEHRSAALFTSDDEDSTPEQFQELADSLASHNAKATFYLMRRTKLSDEQVKKLLDAGHTIGPHINLFDSTDEMYFDFPRVVKEETEVFDKRYGSRSPAVQCHWGPWMGYMDWVEIFRKYNYRMLLAYVSFPPIEDQFMCGTARPMKFVDTDGTIYDSWHQPIIIMDDSWEDRYKKKYANPDGALKQFKTFLLDSFEKHHSPISFLSHPLVFARWSKPHIEACLDILQEKNVPIYNGDQWCQLVDRRYMVKITQKVSAEKVCYTIENLTGKLPLMIPVKKASGREINITPDFPSKSLKKSENLIV